MRLLKWILYILSIPIIYLIISLIFTAITIDREVKNGTLDTYIFLSTNGVHLDIILPKKSIHDSLLSGLTYGESDQFFSFGWGDENFYINTPSWSDLTFKNAFRAMFLESPTLMHVTRYSSKRSDWVKVKVSETELKKLNAYIFGTFRINEKGLKMLLENQGYSRNDDFYKANGSYSCFKTCNSWVNTAFKESGLKSCLWTPYDFGLINKYE